MLVDLKQNTFRFLILSHINELLINKGLIVNSIKRAVQPYSTPKTVKEVDEGQQPSIDPYFTKKIDTILRDLNAFATTDEDLHRFSGSESTVASELRVSSVASNIINQKFMLKSVWGYINKDELGVDLTSSLETSFNDYINVCRNIGTWALFLHHRKYSPTVQLGASTISFLSTKWGPVDFEDDIDDFYNKLFEQIYFYALDGKIKALLDAEPVGIAIHQIKKEKVKFDEYGYVDIKAPLNKLSSSYPNSKFYITDIDYAIAEDTCGTPEVTVETELEKCSDSASLRLKEYEGVKICVKQKPLAPFIPTPIVNPPKVHPPVKIPDPKTVPLSGCVAVAFYFDCSGKSEDYTYWGGAEGAELLVKEVLTDCDSHSLSIRTNGGLTIKKMSHEKTLLNFQQCSHFCGYDIYWGLNIAIDQALKADALQHAGGRHVVIVTHGAWGWSTSDTWGWIHYNGKWILDPSMVPDTYTRVDYRAQLLQKIKDNNLILHVISSVSSKDLTTLVQNTKGSFIQVNNAAEAKEAVAVKIVKKINEIIVKPFKPTAKFTMTDVTGLDAPQTVTFTNQVQTGAIYDWSFGDGTFSQETNPTHSYTENGKYTVILRALVGSTSTEWYSSTYQQNIELGSIYVTPLQAGFTTQVKEGQIPLTIKFYQKCVGLFDSIVWDFGDGKGSTELDPEHTYTKPGSFTVSLTIKNSKTSDSNTYKADWSVETWECFELRVTVDIVITILEKFNFSYDMLIGVTLQKLIFQFESFRDKCSIDVVSDAQYLPKDLKPVAVIDLKYTEIEGSGKYSVPIKIGDDVKWNETGLVKYEEINTDPYSIKLTFNARTAFPSPCNSNLIISKYRPPYLFSKDKNTLGIELPDKNIILVNFPVFDKIGIQMNGKTSTTWNGKTSYTTLEICNILNSALDNSQAIVYPDSYNRPVFASLTDKAIRILSFSEGSTANSIFGFNSLGDLGVPLLGGSNAKYKVALYLACVVNEGSSPYTEYAINKVIGKHRLIKSEFKVVSPNYFEAVYGNYPPVISNRVFLPPGHRYIHHSEITLSNIEATTDIPLESRELTSGYFNEPGCYTSQIEAKTASWSPAIANSKSLFSPYWVGMICNSDSYPANVDLWTEGDDKRFYVSNSLNTRNNCLEIVGNYDFMAPSPVIKNQVTAKKSGPYILPIEPGKNRVIAIRQLAVSNEYHAVTIKEGDFNSPSIDYVLYNPSNQKVQINVGYLSNPHKPKFTPKILSIPYATWSNGQAVSLTGVWEGVGTSYLSCTINPFGHSGDTLTIGYWIDFSNPEIMQLDDWSYIELPFGSGTVDEIIKAMQRNGNWLRKNKSKMSWTQSTTYLNPYGYVIFRNSSGEHQSTYQIVNYKGFLQIKTSIDFDFRIRIGGIPENCYANSIFGWNPLGELGDRVKSPKGPYYTYTYSLDAFVTKDVHPSVRSIFPTYHEAKINRYKEVYSETKEVFSSEGIPIKDSYSWNICGYATLKQSTVVDYYLDVIERMFAALCPTRKGGELPPSGPVIVVKIPPKIVTPIGKGGITTVPPGGTVTVPRKGVIFSSVPSVITTPEGKEIQLVPNKPVTIAEGGTVTFKTETPITLPKGGTVTPPKQVTVTTSTTVEPPLKTYEDFTYLLEKEFPELPKLNNFIQTGIPSDQDVLKYDLPWYSVDDTLKAIAAQVKAEIVELNPECEEIGSVSEPVCSPCSPTKSSSKGSVELLDLACSIIDNDIEEPEEPELLDPTVFYSTNPFLLDPLTSTYSPITSIDYDPEKPALVLKYDVESPNELITTVTPIEEPEIFLDKEFNNDVRVPTLTTTIPLDDNQIITGININDDFLNPVDKFIIDYGNHEILFTFKPIVSDKYTVKSATLIDCYPLLGVSGRKYVFDSSYHGIVELIIPSDRIQLTPDYFIELLLKYLSPFTVDYTNNIITINPGNNSLKLVTSPTPDPFSLENVTIYENELEIVKVGTNLRVNDLRVKEEALPVQIHLFYSYMTNSSLPNSSVYISG